MDFPRFANAFKSCVDSLGLYPPGNPMVERQLKQFHQVLTEAVRLADEFDIQFRDSMLVVNEEVVNERLMRMPVIQWILKLAYERKISRITFEAGVTQLELQNLALLLNELPHQFQTSTDAPSRLERLGVKSIHINAFDRMKAPQVATAKPAVIDKDPFDVKVSPFEFQLPLEEKTALRNDIVQKIKAAQLARVGDMMNLITEDLHSGVRENVELALPGYRVVIEVLIELKQSKPLHQILRSVGEDLDRFEELDVYRYHLATFKLLLEYCLDQKHSGAVAFGLQRITQLARCDHPGKSDLARQCLSELLNESCIRIIIENQERNTPQKAMFTKLLNYGGELFVRPMLSVLYETDDRHIRRGLMAVLESLGPVIHPELVEDLKEAFALERPWYIKRNLLQLLSNNPPPALAAILENQVKGAHPKVIDLIYRCIYSISDQHAFRVGRSWLERSNEENQVRLIGHVGNGCVKAYAPVLMGLIEGESPEAVKRAAIPALARLDSNEGNLFLESLLASGVSLINKLQNRLRALAAESLVQTRNSRCSAILSHHLKDKDRAVRNLAQRALGNQAP